jgi:predicted sulfurtransferase
MPSRIIAFLLSVAALIWLHLSVPAFGEKPPIWWPRALEEARGAGYVLITPEKLKNLDNSGKTFLLLDVRPDYEYRSGHIPNALNLEFHLGDRLKIEPEKKEAIQQILGPDKNRKVVIYCRSFR